MFERAEKFLCAKAITMMKILALRSAFRLKSCRGFLAELWQTRHSYYYLIFEWCVWIFQSIFPLLSHLSIRIPVWVVHSFPWGSAVVTRQGKEDRPVPIPAVPLHPHEPWRGADLLPSLRFLFEETEAQSMFPKHTELAKRNPGLEPKSCCSQNLWQPGLSSQQTSALIADLRQPGLPSWEVPAASKKLSASSFPQPCASGTPWKAFWTSVPHCSRGDANLGCLLHRLLWGSADMWNRHKEGFGEVTSVQDCPS